MRQWFSNRLYGLAVFLLTAGSIFFHTATPHAADTYTVPQTAEVTLAWDANDPTPDGYRVFRRLEGQVYGLRPIRLGRHPE